MLRTYEAGDALAAALSVPGLPTPLRNDISLTGFADSGNGIGWKLAVNNEGVSVFDVQMGEPPEYELNVRFGIALAIEGEPGATRDGVLKLAMQTLADALFPGGIGLAIPGHFDDLTIEGDVQHDHVPPAEQGTPPVEIIQFTVSLVLTAPTPFG